MTHRRIGLLLAFAFLSLFFLSCKKTTTLPPAPQNLVFEDRTLSWDPVEGALGYLVSLAGTDYPVSGTSLDLPEGVHGQMSATVRAEFATATGSPSDPLDFTAYWTLPVPGDLRQEDGTLFWEPVPLAEGYVVAIGGAEHAVTGASYDFGTLESPAEVRLLAVGNEAGTLVSSPWSDPFLLTVKLAAPTGLSLADGVVSWDAVPHATGYQLTVDGDVRSVTGTSLSLGYDYAGIQTVSVIAVATTAGYLASDPASADLDFPTLTLATPENLVNASGLLSFDSVPGAVSYDVYADGVFRANIAETEWGIPNDLLAAPGTYLQVKAVSLVHHSSDLSEALYLSSIPLSSEADLLAMEEDGSYLLTNDIVLTQPWIPKNFRGVLQGSGFTISGIAVSGDYARTGFFGLLEDALVENLTLEGTVLATFSGTEGSCAGGLAGEIRNSVVNGVTIAMDLSAVSENGLAFAGGMAGKITGSSFSDCLVAGDLTFENAVAGGFAGKATVSAAAVSIIRCGYEGTLVVTGGEQSVAGGFVGTLTDSFLTISLSYARGSVQGTSYVGGFVGYLGTGHAENCYFAGEVSGTGAELLFLGGFVGRAEGYNATLVSCLAQTVLTPYAENPSINVGGFAGHTPGGTYGTIYVNCHYDNTLAPFDRIGNPSTGRGDGITAKGASSWSTLSGIDPETWNFDGTEIRLAWEYAE